MVCCSILPKYAQFTFETLNLNAVNLTSVQCLTPTVLSIVNQTQTLDMLFVLSGSINLTLEQQPITLSAGYVLIVRPNDHFEVEWSASTTVIIVSLPITTLRKYLIDYFGVVPFKNIIFHPVYNGNAAETEKLFVFIRYLSQEINSHSSLIKRGISIDHLEGQLVLLLMDTLVWNYIQDVKGKLSSLNPRYIKKALAYIIENEKKQFSVHELATIAGVGLRTLQTGFQQVYGISPMCYVRRYKLMRVRERLLGCVSDSVTIGDIAAQWGFLHPSQFAKNYHEFFGEYPSDTLKQHKL